MKASLVSPGRAAGSSAGPALSRLGALLVAGCLTVLGAWFYRQQFNKRFHPLPAALLDPRTKELAARVDALQTEIERNPRSAQPHWDLADIYQQVGLRPEAAEQLQAITQLEPRNCRAHVALGNMRLALEQFDAAAQEFRTATTLEPRQGAAWQALATVLYHQRHYVEAREAAVRAVRLTPTDINMHYTLGVVDVEFALQYPNPQTHSTQLSEAVLHLKGVLSAWPDNPDVFYRLGRAYFGMRDARNAIKYLKRAHEMSPARTDISLLLCNTYRIAGQLDAARQTAMQALQAAPADPGLNDFWGQLLETSPSPDAQSRVIGAFQKALAARPQDATLHQKLGSAYQQAGKLDEARTEFERAIQLDPNRAFPYQQLSNLYTRLKQPKQADFYAKLANAATANDRQLQNVEAVSKMHPKSVPLHLILADRYRDLGRMAIARGEYEIVLKLDPHNQRAQAGLAAVDKSGAGTLAPLAPQPSPGAPSAPAPGQPQASGLPARGDELSH